MSSLSQARVDERSHRWPRLEWLTRVALIKIKVSAVADGRIIELAVSVDL